MFRYDWQVIPTICPPQPFYFPFQKQIAKVTSFSRPKLHLLEGYLVAIFLFTSSDLFDHFHNT